MSIPGEGAGKGDTPRPTDKKQYDENWIRIFGVECSACKGVGFIKNFTGNGNEFEKENCLVCYGLGKVAK